MSFDLPGAVGAQAVLCGAAEAANDVDGLRTKLDLGGDLQGALPVDDLQRNTGLRVFYQEVPCYMSVFSKHLYIISMFKNKNLQKNHKISCFLVSCYATT